MDKNKSVFQPIKSVRTEGWAEYLEWMTPDLTVMRVHLPVGLLSVPIKKKSTQKWKKT